MGDVGPGAIDALKMLPGGIVDAARLPARAVHGDVRSQAWAILRGGTIGLPIAVLFVLLLSADGRFRATLAAFASHAGEGAELAAWTAMSIAAVLVACTTLGRVRRARERALVASASLEHAPYRVEGDVPVSASASPSRRAPWITPLSWSVILLQVVAVFALYVGASAGTLFAGHALVRAHGTVTYAQYLHEGFAQVSVATLLAVACVLAGQELVTGGKRLMAIELGLLGLVGVTLVSCAHRLGIYEEAYGYTYLRLGVWFLHLGVAGLLVMTAARAIARGWSGFGAALAWSVLIFGVLASSFDADGWIARRNVARAVGSGAPMDVAYLASLSEDASGVLPAVQAYNPLAGDVLRRAWGQSWAWHHTDGWRSRRGLGQRGF
jgi:hypothetical protein